MKMPMLNIWTASDIVAKSKKLSRKKMVSNATNRIAPIIEAYSSIQ
jgi:hypothetical protein